MSNDSTKDFKNYCDTLDSFLRGELEGIEVPEAKRYELTANDIQAYLCWLGIEPTAKVSLPSIRKYFDEVSE